MIEKKRDDKLSELTVSVKADAQEWKNAWEKSFKKLSSNLTIKGFRKGNVPLEEAKKHISDKEIMSNAIETMLEPLAKHAHSSLTEEDKILDSPAYDIEKISEAELVVRFVYPVYPNITVGEYKGHKVNFEKHEVTDEEVTREIDAIRDRRSMLKPKKEAIIANGDVVTFDFEGFVDGVAFDGGKAEDYQLEIGSGHFIPGFEEQMINLAKGDERSIKVTFPKDYHETKLKNKEATFTIKIKEIETKTRPEVDEEFIKELKIPNVKTKDELFAYLKDLHKREHETQSKIKFQREMFEKIKAKTHIVIPKQLLNKEAKVLFDQLQENLKRQGLDVQKYLEFTKMSKEDFHNEIMQQAHNRLMDTFIFAEIAKLENVKVSDEEMEAQYKKFAELYKREVEDIKKIIPSHQAAVPVINEKVIDLLIKYNSK